MKNLSQAALCCGIAVSALALQNSPAMARKTLPNITVALVGDSTVAPNGGWGDDFARMLKPQAKALNLAKGGRSSKSFRDEGHWKPVIEAKPDWVLIQFGHNDQPGKGPERETDPNTTYAQNLATYVDEARAIGAKPVLITSLARRYFKPDGKITSSLTPYADAAKRVAKEKKVPLVDLHKLSIKELEKIGPTAAALYDRPTADPLKPDRTHLSGVGSIASALLVAKSLKKVAPKLGRYVDFTIKLEPIVLPPKPSAPVAKAEIKPDFIVAQDGSGNFKTVQEAIDAAPNKSEKRTVILIKSGIYKSHLVIPSDKTNLTLLGEKAETTILTNDLHVKSVGADGKEVGTIGSASVVISPDDFWAENLTFENNAPHLAQALAVYFQGDRAVLRNCRFLGWQDTIRVRKGRQYFQNCFVNGRTDFIYGEATAFFDRCHIHVLEQGWITAANTPQDKKYGLVFFNCRITGEAGVKTMLGRPWRPYAQTVWLNTEMENVIDPEGWNNWGNVDNEATARYSEYNSRNPDGDLVDVSKRVKWSKQLTAEEAAEYTLEKVFGDWNPNK